MPIQARVTQGKRLLTLEPRDHVVEVAARVRSGVTAGSAAAGDDGAGGGGRSSRTVEPAASRSRASGRAGDQLDLIDSEM